MSRKKSVGRPKLPQSQHKKRDYKREDAKFKSSASAKKKAAERKSFRRDAEKKGLVKKWDNKQVHHKKWGGYVVIDWSKNMGMKEKSRIKWSKRDKKSRGKK